MPRTMLYQSVGEKLTAWNVDVDAMAITPLSSVTMPSNVQYVWPHPTRKFLYVTTSDAASGNTPAPGSVHRLCALAVDGDGRLSHHGAPAALPQRPIHHSLDRSGRFALTCYNKVSDLTVHRIRADGTVGDEVRQAAALDKGIFAHQIVALPSNRTVLMVARGNRPEATKPEDPGALLLYGFDEGSGQLAPRRTLAVGGRGGFGYGPRHVDFHPSKPWVYVSIETQNELHMHRLEGDDLSPEPLFSLPSTAGRYGIDVPQIAGGIHVHPSGRTVYVSNRANATVERGGRRVFRGGENNIAVFAIDQATGEPRLVQHAETGSYHVRTFSIDPTGRMLVAASIHGLDVDDGAGVRHVPAALTLFRIGDDGRLDLVRKYDVETGSGRQQWWSGLVAVA